MGKLKEKLSEIGNPPRELNEGFFRLYYLRYGYPNFWEHLFFAILADAAVIYFSPYILKIPSTTINIIAIVTSLFILISVLFSLHWFLLYKIRIVLRSRRLYREGIATIGKVVEIKGKWQDVAKFIYEFQDQLGNTIKSSIWLDWVEINKIGGEYIFEPTKIKEGDEITVFYDKKNPKINDVYELMRLDKKPEWWWWPGD